MTTSGNKEKMIERLLSKVNIKLLEKRFTKQYYELTNKGEKVVIENEYIKYIHKNKIEDLNIWSLNKLMNDLPNGFKYRDIIWGYLNSQSMEHISNRQYNLYSNCRYTMYTVLTEEKRTENAIKMLTEVAYYDLSGLCNGSELDIKEYIRRYAFPYNESLVDIVPAKIRKFEKYKKANGLSDSEFKVIIKKHMDRFSTEFHLFTKEECVNIILNAINKNVYELNKIYTNAQNRFYEQYGEVYDKKS
jgi:hypothetical protein